jgi:hypothetical protein
MGRVLFLALFSHRHPVTVAATDVGHSFEATAQLKLHFFVVLLLETLRLDRAFLSETLFFVFGQTKKI